MPALLGLTSATCSMWTSIQVRSKVMTKVALIKAIANLASIATTEIKKNGIFTAPGLRRIRTLLKPATNTGIRMAFAAETKRKVKPGRTIVEAFPVSTLTTQI